VARPRRCLVCRRPGPFPALLSGGRVRAPLDHVARLVRCPGCGLVFQDPQPSADWQGPYYQDPDFSAALLGPLRGFTLEQARRKLRPLRRAGIGLAGARVLDVGCSSGAWLELAAAAGAEAVGVEVGEATAAAARERGLDVRTGTLEQALGGLAGERFDLISFWDVLEHLPDPRRELDLAAGLLAPGGTLAATMPNVRGWYPRLTLGLVARNTRTAVWEYPEVGHLYDFSPVTIRRLLESCGFRVAALETFATPFAYYRQTTLSAERLGSGPSGRLLRLAFEALRLPVYPLARAFGQGNAMFVAAGAR
jgi:2-polyprenyl-3-methyl-5-hydroxy-6-metoxy-1,4-benzoquinol methylase